MTDYNRIVSAQEIENLISEYNDVKNDKDALAGYKKICKDMAKACASDETYVQPDSRFITWLNIYSKISAADASGEDQENISDSYELYMYRLDARIHRLAINAYSSKFSEDEKKDLKKLLDIREYIEDLNGEKIPVLEKYKKRLSRLGMMDLSDGRYSLKMPAAANESPEVSPAKGEAPRPSGDTGPVDNIDIDDVDVLGPDDLEIPEDAGISDIAGSRGPGGKNGGGSKPVDGASGALSQTDIDMLLMGEIPEDAEISEIAESHGLGGKNDGGESSGKSDDSELSFDSLDYFERESESVDNADDLEERPLDLDDYEGLDIVEPDPISHAEVDELFRSKKPESDFDLDLGQYPEEEVDGRVRSKHSEQNQDMLDRIALEVYWDINAISAKDYLDGKKSPAKAHEIISKIPDLKGKKAIKFSEKFVDMLISDPKYSKSIPPAALANAYIGVKERIKSAKGEKRRRLESQKAALAARMDKLSEDFARPSGPDAHRFVDWTNIADVYSGYNKMFRARMKDLEWEEKNKEKIEFILSNKKALEGYVGEYDKIWELEKVGPEQAKGISKRWDDLQKKLKGAKISDETFALAANYVFPDKKGGLARVVELAKHTVALQNIGAPEKSKEDLEGEMDEMVLFKLFEMDNSEKIIEGALEDPDKFSDIEHHYKQFVEGLKGPDGGAVSKKGWEAAMDAEVNQTAGFAARLKQKLGPNAEKVLPLFGKLFKPIKDIDRRAGERTERSEHRSKRIEFAARALKGFGSAFLIGGVITAIAAAAASVTGVAFAIPAAMIGTVAGISVLAFQIHKWRARQKSMGLPADIKAFFRDPRNLAMAATTLLAVAAMIVGAKGIANVAFGLGYGAFGIGMWNNGFLTFKDALKSGMSPKESFFWSVLNSSAIGVGAIAGHVAAAGGIGLVNKIDSDNTVFQQKETHVEKTDALYEDRTVYSDSAKSNAERIAKMWYGDDQDMLQSRVEMIRQYNAEHGTAIDPHRAVLMNADAGGEVPSNLPEHMDGGGVQWTNGNHNVINTPEWRAAYGFGADEMDALKNMFRENGLTEEAVNAAVRADGIVSARNEVGVLPGGGPAHYDGVIPSNAADEAGRPIYTSYASGESAFATERVLIREAAENITTTITPNEVRPMAGMFGNLNLMSKAEKLKERAGALMDRIVKRRAPGR
jgi:hypothetical protein